MTVSGLSSATLQSVLQQLNSGSSNGTSSSVTSLLNDLNNSGQSSTTNSATPAYVLSSSQKQSQSQLLSYSNLGALINKSESSLSDLINQNGAGVAVDGLGRPLTSSVSVSVDSLASAQTLTSGSYPSTSTDVFGTGTLKLTVGTGTPVSIDITDGSLDGVSSAINNAAAGIASKVVQNNDGSYGLQITGNQTGAANSFALSGLSDLVYDPSTGVGTLQATTTAADASYSVGGVSHTSPTNDNVQVAPGVTTSFTQTGTQTLTSPIGQSNASNSAQTLVSDFNALVSADPTTSSSTASGKSTLTQILDAIAGQTFGTGASSKSLSDLGITVGSNGTLSVDQTKLSSAYTSDPAAFNSVISQAAEAIKSKLSQGNGVADQVKSSVQSLVTQMAHIPTLAEVLSGSSNSASGSSSTSVASQILSGFTA